MRTVRQAAADHHRWQAWTSDKERLLRIARMLDSLITAFRNNLARTKPEGSNPTTPHSVEEHYEVQLEARQKEFSLQQIGRPEDVLAQVDVQVLTSVTLFVGPEQESLRYPYRLAGIEPPLLVPRRRSGDYAFATVTFSRSYGASLDVGGSDRDWVLKAFTDLRGEISKGVPMWAWLRSNWMWWAYAFLGLVVGLIALEPSLGDSDIWYVLSAMGVAVLIGTTLIFLAKGMLPGFEVVDSGRPARGGRIVGLIGTIILNIAIGVLVNIWTQP